VADVAVARKEGLDFIDTIVLGADQMSQAFRLYEIFMIETTGGAVLFVTEGPGVNETLYEDVLESVILEVPEKLSLVPPNFNVFGVCFLINTVKLTEVMNMPNGAVSRNLLPL
jgi:hypothetical protein